MEILSVQRGVHCGCAFHSTRGGHHPETVPAVLLVLNNFHVTVSWLSHHGTLCVGYGASTFSWC